MGASGSISSTPLSNVFGGCASAVANGTNFVCVNGYHAVAPTAEDRAQIMAPRAMTLTSLKTRNYDSAGAGTVVFTVRVNGVDTALTTSHTGVANTQTSTGSVSVASGDRISISVVATLAGTPDVGWGVEFAG